MEKASILSTGNSLIVIILLTGIFPFLFLGQGWFSSGKEFFGFYTLAGFYTLFGLG
jgi:hypothetical protein